MCAWNVQCVKVAHSNTEWEQGSNHSLKVCKLVVSCVPMVILEVLSVL